MLQVECYIFPFLYSLRIEHFSLSTTFQCFKYIYIYIYIVFHIDTWLSQHYFLKSSSFLHWSSLSLSVSLSLLMVSILTHWSVCLTLWQCYTILSTATLEISLDISGQIQLPPPTLPPNFPFFGVSWLLLAICSSM